MTTRPDLLRPLDLNLNPRVYRLLAYLGDEMFGSRKPLDTSSITAALREQNLLQPVPGKQGEFLPYQGRYRGDFFKNNDFFFSDDAQGEDGKTVEKQVRFGRIRAYAQLSSADNDSVSTDLGQRPGSSARNSAVECDTAVQARGHHSHLAAAAQRTLQIARCRRK